MNDDRVVQHLMEIKERLASIEAKQDQHIDQHAILAARVDEHEHKIVGAEAAISALRWAGGALLLGLPATAVAIVRIWKSN